MIVMSGRAVVAAILCQRSAGSAAPCRANNTGHQRSSSDGFNTRLFSPLLDSFQSYNVLIAIFPLLTRPDSGAPDCSRPNTVRVEKFAPRGGWQFAENLAQNCNIANLQSHAIPVSFFPAFFHPTNSWFTWNIQISRGSKNQRSLVNQYFFVFWYKTNKI